MSKRVVHLGPTKSRGGMSIMISNLIINTPDDYTSIAIDSHTDGNLASKFFKWRRAKSRLKMMIKENKIDILHVHVTHSFSWWRKNNIVKVCKKQIPVIFHIHSGRFDKFCSFGFGICGFFVRRTLIRNNIKVILLEKRWLKLLEKWIPENSHVISNFSMAIHRKVRKVDNGKLKILMLSRKSKGKRHDFALKIARKLVKKGFDFEMIMTGLGRNSVPEDLKEVVINKEWVTEIEKYELINAANVLIMPSDFEGSSMSVIESVVNGLPCLVSKASAETIGIQELSISLDSVEEWVKKLISLSDSSVYENIQKKIIERSYFFNEIKNKQKILELYDSMF
ncbi:glycosyltransferase family 4 protein [Euryarchaeota archaeon]|nr:glycosyltransferase family 4 protein [Euryarchaeota archaeon]